jgi:hypothetical protein
MLKKFVVPALVALGLVGATLAPVAHAQKPTPAPKMGGKMDKMKPKSDKKMPMRGKDGKFLKKGDKKDDDAKKGGKKGPERGPDGKFLKKSDKMKPVGKMGKMSGGKMGKSDKMDKMSGGKMASGKPEWDAKVNRWRLNGKFVSEADALKMGGKK